MKVLILYNQLFHYRIPIFKIIAEKVELTVAYSIGVESKNDLNFNTHFLPIYKFGRFVIHKNNIHKLCNNFNIVIAYGDIGWLSLSTLAFRKKRRYKVILWSPGVSASYNKKFDTVTKWDTVRDFFYKRADALIFYTDYPINKYKNRGFDSEKLFVAINTVEVYNNKLNNKIKKDSLLFIGSLYSQKGILTLLENYKSAFEINHDILPLNIVGGGTELEKVKTWIIENDFSKKIFLVGPIYDIEEKSLYFKKAVACISPTQAGLSVLESFGYGVPFITMNDSITGGERLNILDGFNGILLNKLSEIKKVIIDISNDRDKYIKMGENAKNYYNNRTKPVDMAKGLLDAIEFVKD